MMRPTSPSCSASASAARSRRALGAALSGLGRGGAADAGRRHPAAADCHPVRHQHAGMDGLSLLREVKKVRPEIPVMMVTAYGDDERRRRATELGAAEFLTKPVDFDSLRVRLRLLSIAAD